MSEGTRTALALVKSAEENDEERVVKITVFGEETQVQPRKLSENTRLVLALAASQEDINFLPEIPTESKSNYAQVNPNWQEEKVPSRWEKFPSDSDAKFPEESSHTTELSSTAAAHSKEIEFFKGEKEQVGLICSIEERDGREHSVSTTSVSVLEFEMKVLNVNVQRKQEIEMNVFKSSNKPIGGLSNEDVKDKENG